MGGTYKALPLPPPPLPPPPLLLSETAAVAVVAAAAASMADHARGVRAMGSEQRLTREVPNSQPKDWYARVESGRRAPLPPTVAAAGQCTPAAFRNENRGAAREDVSNGMEVAAAGARVSRVRVQDGTAPSSLLSARSVCGHARVWKRCNTGRRQLTQGDITHLSDQRFKHCRGRRQP